MQGWYPCLKFLQVVLIGRIVFLEVYEQCPQAIEHCIALVIILVMAAAETSILRVLLHHYLCIYFWNPFHLQVENVVTASRKYTFFFFFKFCLFLVWFFKFFFLYEYVHFVWTGWTNASFFTNSCLLGGFFGRFENWSLDGPDSFCDIWIEVNLHVIYSRLRGLGELCSMIYRSTLVDLLLDPRSSSWAVWTTEFPYAGNPSLLRFVSFPRCCLHHPSVVALLDDF